MASHTSLEDSGPASVVKLEGDANAMKTVSGDDALSNKTQEDGAIFYDLRLTLQRYDDKVAQLAADQQQLEQTVSKLQSEKLQLEARLSDHETRAAAGPVNHDESTQTELPATAGSAPVQTSSEVYEARIAGLQIQVDDYYDKIQKLNKRLLEHNATPDSPADSELVKDFENLFRRTRDVAESVINTCSHDKEWKVRVAKQCPWLENFMPFATGESSDEYRLWTITSLLAFIIVDWLIAEGPFGDSNKSNNDHLYALAQTVKELKAFNPVGYKKTLVPIRDAFTAKKGSKIDLQIGQRKERLNNELLRCLKGATSLKIAANNDAVADLLDDLVEESIGFYTKIIFHPASYTFVPERSTLSEVDTEDLKPFKPDSHVDIAERAGSKNLADRHVHGFVFPALIKTHDEQGVELLKHIRLCPTRVVTERDIRSSTSRKMGKKRKPTPKKRKRGSDSESEGHTETSDDSESDGEDGESDGEYRPSKRR